MTDQTKLLTNDRSSLNNHQDQFFEEPISESSEVATSISSATGEVTDMIDAVDSAASFEPVDCEKLGMVYIPLFAEEIFRSNSLNIKRAKNSIGFK